jgi:DNA-binding NarL/FixJ family response regulator
MQPTPSPAAPASASTLRVALVEDDPAFRAAFSDAIQAAPDMHLCAVASSLVEGMAMLRGAAAHVLLCDLGLPDGNGIEVIVAAQSLWPDCAVVVTTAFGDEAHVLASIEAGASGYLLKDAAPQDVVHEIRVLQQGGSPISPLIARRVLQRLRGATPAAAIAGEATLSQRETQVLELVAKGFQFDEIAQRLEVSRHTIQTFVRRIYAKLEVHSKTEAVHEARRMGLLRD